jgi:hypothetical protein
VPLKRDTNLNTFESNGLRIEIAAQFMNYLLPQLIVLFPVNEWFEGFCSEGKFPTTAKREMFC